MTRSLTDIHSEYITESRVSLMDTPISPRESDVPVIAVDRWQLQGDPKTLSKSFLFQTHKHRDEFIMGLLEYEVETQHHAAITINERDVFMSLITKTIEQVTALDKEYSVFADQLYKDIVYSV